jgi:GT2 family glycosyltransferase
VLKAAAQIECEVFVVDNSSTDGSEAYLSGKFPGVIFRWNQTNLGFGKASNSVLAEAKGEHILFLNPDTIIPENCFTKSLAFFETHPDCGALGVRMLDGSGNFLKESKRGLPSALGSFFKLAGLARIFSSSKTFAQYYAGHLPEKENCQVEVLAGAFMMLSKNAILATRGFDEDFFMYGEDIDLSYRISKAGMINYYFADTTIIHFKGESTKKFSSKYVEHFYGAMELFVKKHAAANSNNLRLILLAIRAKKALAGLKKRRTIKYASKPGSKTAIVASQKVFTECVSLVKHASPPVLLVGRIAPEPQVNQTAIGDVNHLKETIMVNKVDQVIFCEADLSFEKIIHVMETNRGKASFLFHGKGSQSIVGSNDKNSEGLFIALAEGDPHSATTP